MTDTGPTFPAGYSTDAALAHLHARVQRLEAATGNELDDDIAAAHGVTPPEGATDAFGPPPQPASSVPTTGDVAGQGDDPAAARGRAGAADDVTPQRTDRDNRGGPVAPLGGLGGNA